MLTIITIDTRDTATPRPSTSQFVVAIETVTRNDLPDLTGDLRITLSRCVNIVSCKLR